MVLSIPNETYAQIAVGSPLRLQDYETEDGVMYVVANAAGGVKTWSRRLVPWGDKEDIQYCQHCGKPYSAHSYPGGCFGCSVGLK